MPKNPEDLEGIPRIKIEHPLVGNSETGNVAGVAGFFGINPNDIFVLANPAVGTVPLKAGVFGCSDGNGVQGHSSSKTDSGVWGHNSHGGYGVTGTSDKPNGIGIFGRGKALAGMFEGSVVVSGGFTVGGSVAVTGNIDVKGDINLTNADCAEDFDVIDPLTAEPGTVMVLGDEGGLSPSSKAYDKRVAGVVSGAGSYKPGIVLDKQESDRVRRPIALLGKVFCKVDAQHGAIEVGDLLTTSPTPGHAMRADDPMKAFGTVIGKALRPFAGGKGMIPILIALQ
jgi:hypothetical protein